MKWEVRGMRRGQPGRWMIEAPSEDRARQKAEAAGVTLGRVDPIGQITSATMAFALAAGGGKATEPPRRRTVGWPTAGAACLACAAAFGAGGYFLGVRSAATGTSPIVWDQSPTAQPADASANAIPASASASHSNAKAKATGPLTAASQR